MKPAQWLVRSVCAIAAVSLGGGCGESDGGPVTASVTGVITYQGSPIEGAIVTLVPSGADTTAKSAVGITDASGQWTLSTFRNGDGAIPGFYDVKIAKVEAPSSGPAPIEPGATEEECYVPPEEYETAAVRAPPKSALPAKYADHNTSGLKVTITEGENSLRFDLDD